MENIRKRLYKIITIIMLIGCSSYPLFSQWQTIVVPINNQYLNSIYFINSSTAYIGGNNKMAFTNNDFASVTAINFLVDIQGNVVPYFPNVINDLHFTSVNDGFCTGIFNLQNEYDVFKTDNGAANWTFQLNDNNGGLPRYLSAFDFKGSIAVSVGSAGRMYRSSDGGDNWTGVNSNTFEDLLDVTFLQGNNVISCGDGVVSRSSDNGLTWAADTSFNNDFIYALSKAPNSNTVFMNSSSIVYKSTNGGTTFNSYAFPFSNMQHIFAINTDTVLVGTGAGVYISYDGALHWQQFATTQNFIVNKVAYNAPYMYALCDSSTLLRADINTTPAEPFASFDYIEDNLCGVTHVTCTNNSDPGYTMAWYLNGAFVSSSYNYNIDYTVTTPNQEIKLIVTSPSGTDTAIVKNSIYVKKLAVAIAQPDEYNCYGQEMILSGKDTLGQYIAWLPQSKLNLLYFGLNADSVLTKPILQQQDTIIFQTKNNDNCIALDTVFIFTTPPAFEPFKKVVPGLKDFCSNAPCNFISGLDFINNQEGFGFANTTEFLKTTDGGATYSKLFLQPLFSQMNGPNFSSCDIDFIDQNIGYIGWGPLKTTDGGTTWNKIQNFLSITDGQLSFLNADTGIFSKGAGELYGTDDGGVSYSTIYSSVANGYMLIKDIFMYDDNHLFIAGAKSAFGYNTEFKKSTDGGATWIALNIPDLGGIESISIPHPDTLFAITNTNFIISSFDGGQTFTSYFLEIGNGNAERRISMLNSQVGYIGATQGHIFKTTNSGSCWQKVFTVANQQCNAIAVTPTKDQIYFAYGYDDSTAVIYNFQSYHKLIATVDAAQCSFQPVCTHNLSTGYTSFKWYLDNVFITNSRDTCITFTNAGAHILKLVADSANIIVDSISFPINVLNGSSSVKPLTGDSAICSNYQILSGSNHDYFVQGNASIVTYHWYSDLPNAIFYGLQGETDSLASVYYAPNPNFTNTLNIFVYGETAAGCLSDTASIHVVLNHALPPDATNLTLADDCLSELTSSFSSGLPVDSIFCTTTNQLSKFALYYNFSGLPPTTQPSVYLPVYAQCPGQQSVALYLANGCGISTNPKVANYNLEYLPQSIVNTPDTIVKGGAMFDILFYPQYDADVMINCTTPDIVWFKDGMPTGYFGNTYPIPYASQFDSALYTAAIINFCDTIFTNILIVVDVAASTNEITESNFKIIDDGKIVRIQNPYFETFNLQLINMLGDKIGSYKINYGMNTFDLSALAPQLYILQANSKSDFIKYKLLRR